MFNRIFLVVLDSLGIGALPDAKNYGDEGANTLKHTIGEVYNLDVLETLGLTKLIGKEEKTAAAFRGPLRGKTAAHARADAVRHPLHHEGPRRLAEPL